MTAIRCPGAAVELSGAGGRWPLGSLFLGGGRVSREVLGAAGQHDPDAAAGAGVAEHPGDGSDVLPGIVEGVEAGHRGVLFF